MADQEGPSGSSGAQEENVKQKSSTEEADAFTALFDSYFGHQEELLHLATFLSTREAEIDNAKERARAKISREFPHVDPDAFDGVWAYMSRVLGRDDKEQRSAAEPASGESASAQPEESAGIRPDTEHSETSGGDPVTTENPTLEVDDGLLQESEGAAGPPNDEDSGDEAPEDSSLKTLRLALAKVPKDCASEYLADIIMALGHPSNGTPRLLSMLLTNLIGDFEVLIGNLLRLLYKRNPGHLTSERGFALSDVTKFSSIDAFKDHVLDKAVDKVFFDGYTDWLKVLNEKFSVPVPANANDDFILEAFQRRHVVVHNGSKVSQQYIDKVPKAFADVKVGQMLRVDPEYLRKAADHLFVTAMSLVCVSGFKQLKRAEDRKEIEEEAAYVLYRLLQAERYEPVRDLTQLHPAKSFTDSSSALLWTINGWLALKRLNQFETCRKEVEKWDTGTLEPKFKLARLALLDEFEPALEIVKEIRGTKQLPYRYWAAWPLLQELRGYELECDVEQETVATEAA